MANIELYKARMEHADGTKAFYPHTSTDIVFDNTGKSVDTILNNIYDGTKQVGDASKLGGKAASDYATKTDLESIASSDMSVFIGTNAEYTALTEEQKSEVELFVCTDEEGGGGTGGGGSGVGEDVQKELDTINSNITKIVNGTTQVGNAAKLGGLPSSDYALQANTSNPNLLANGDFQVNTQGKTEYTYVANPTYTVDKWYFNNNKTSVTVNDNSITFYTTDTNGIGYLRQAVDVDIANNIYTLSAKIDGVVYTHTFNSSKNDKVFDSGVYFLLSNTNCVVGMYKQGVTSIEIEWVKLERGSVATPFIPLSYDEELVRCGGLATLQSDISKIQTSSSARISAIGWYRVAEYTHAEASYVTGTASNTFKLIVKRNSNSANGETHELLINSIRNTQNIKSLNSKCGAQTFTKARYVNDTTNSKDYIEVYYNTSVYNQVLFAVSDVLDYKSCWQAITPTLTQETAEGCTVTCTYDIPKEVSILTTADDIGSGGSVDLSGIETQISNIVDGTTVVGKASKDSDGNVIKDTYAKQADLTKVVDGTTKVGKAGTADSATKATQDGSGNTITSTYVNLTGDQTIGGNKTFSGGVYFAGGTNYYVSSNGGAKLSFVNAGSATIDNGVFTPMMEFRGMGSSANNGGYIDFHYNDTSNDYTTRLIEQSSGVLTCTGAMKIGDTTASSSTSTGALVVSGGVGVAGNIYGSKVYGAVYNDYAERRLSETEIKPGYVVHELGDDLVGVCNKDLSSTAMLVTDTYGFLIGDEQDGLYSIPVGLSGRVLAYVSESSSKLSIGDVVCAAADGKIRKMTKKEKVSNPECIIGVVGSIPKYEQWGSNNIEVDGRVWINLK